MEFRCEVPEPPRSQVTLEQMLVASLVVDATKSVFPSCWGCGHDYLERWTALDLGPHPNPDGDPDIDDEDKVCPDCHEEIVGAE